MAESNVRKPVRNFFIKKSLQIRIIVKIVCIILFAAILTTAMLIWFYQVKSGSGSFYYMSNNVQKDIELKSIVGIILPGVVIAEVVMMLIGVWIGLFTSRQTAVPLYKFEKWVRQLENGRLKTKLAFREHKGMTDLTMQCNSMVDTYRTTFLAIREAVDTAQKNSADAENVEENLRRIRGLVERFDV